MVRVLMDVKEDSSENPDLLIARVIEPHSIARGTLLALVIGADIALSVELIAVAAGHKLGLLFLR